MVRVKHFGLLYVVALYLIFLQPSAFSQNGAVTLDEVEGLNADNKLIPGQTIKFIFNLDNYTGYNVSGLTHGFRVYSPDGATWQPIKLDTFNLGWSSYFPLAISFGSAGVTGSGADTVAFGAAGMPYQGFPDGYFSQVWWIETQVELADAGKHICVDSSFCPVAYKWLWALSNSSEYTPNWSGMMCYEIAGPDDDFYIIPSVYENIDTLEGKEIRVLG
ncbi:MAG: hypothetical protein JXA92_06330, partial [candidate division Zixibacteria bacterium]|nr:hypothetical protein [candidate division Zixibacteria bacterium]